MLADLARRGVDVRGLVWRSHSDRAHFSEKENRDFGELVNEADEKELFDLRVAIRRRHARNERSSSTKVPSIWTTSGQRAMGSLSTSR